MNPSLEQILSDEGVIVRRQHRGLRASIDWALRTGELRAVLPGILLPAVDEISWQAVCLAVCAYSPDAVITGEAAARLGYWTELRVGRVSAYHKHALSTSPLIAWHRNRVPPEWVIERSGLRFSAPAWTAVDLCGSGCADPIDRALRARVSLDDMWCALGDMKNRSGNHVRRLLLKDSRDQPWSAAERLTHQVFRKADLKGWTTNYAFAGYFLDIAFLREKLNIEVDGYEYHGHRAAKEHDSMRDQVLATNGWQTLRITWQQLTDDPAGVVTRVRMTLRQRRRQLVVSG